MTTQNEQSKNLDPEASTWARMSGQRSPKCLVLAEELMVDIQVAEFWPLELVDRLRIGAILGKVLASNHGGVRSLDMLVCFLGS